MRGAHLLIEKPIAATLDGGGRDPRAGRRRAACWWPPATWSASTRALRACEPYLDGPRFIESHRLAPFNPRGTDVAVVLDLMIHDIDLLLGLVRTRRWRRWMR